MIREIGQIFDLTRLGVFGGCVVCVTRSYRVPVWQHISWPAPGAGTGNRVQYRDDPFAEVIYGRDECPPVPLRSTYGQPWPL